MPSFYALDEKKLNEVKGGGVLGAIAGGVIGFMVGIPVGMTIYTVGRSTGSVKTRDFHSIMKDSMLAGAGIGMMIGASSPTP